MEGLQNLSAPGPNIRLRQPCNQAWPEVVWLPYEWGSL